MNDFPLPPLMNPIFRISPILLVAGLLSCERQAPDDASHAPGETPAGESITIEASPADLAARVTAKAFAALSGRLAAAIAEDGHPGAIDVCSIEASDILDGVARARGLEVRRVTDRPRNPANQADETDLEVMEMIRGMLAQGEDPVPHVTTEASVTTVRLPIRIAMPLCLTCHGDPATDIAPDTLAAIGSRYPLDRATGYREGDLRGLWRVTIPTPTQP